MRELIEAGERAPEFTVEGSDGTRYRLAELLLDSRVLLIFYPGNNTPG